ncbi:YcjF family protein [Acidimangrovimonas sediminis]|uniref:YcjF family protein n=1 Tax=Acidimangrovimonas sediminis TaxID=2056283 RepID=UPI000C7F97AD|nr:TIGR01620 family protein [Acidimangrovimonas sediminis]
MTRRPVIFELEDEADPSAAPPVPEAEAPEGRAMQAAASFAARRSSRLGRWFWGLLASILGFAISVAAWTFVTDLMARYPLLGWIATVLIAAFVLVVLVIAARELSAFARLKRVDTIHRAAEEAIAAADLKAARGVVAKLDALYAHRPEVALGRERLAARQEDSFDADGLIALAEDTLLAPLDAQALREVEGAARSVATVTALVPLALADVVTALGANLRMIRRVAEIYGGRSGTLGSWRLTRSVMTHLVATGAVAVGDDLVHSVAGGHLLAKVSRRFGEGFVNGALTARVGVAAMEVCRPLPFRAARRPSVSAVIGRALTGLFGRT